MAMLKMAMLKVVCAALVACAAATSMDGGGGGAPPPPAPPPADVEASPLATDDAAPPPPAPPPAEDLEAFPLEDEALTDVMSRAAGENEANAFLQKQARRDVPVPTAEDVASLRLKPRVVSFNVMVSGLSGLGKTTCCDMLFEHWHRRDQKKPRRHSASLGDRPQIHHSTKHVDVSRCFERFDEATNTIVRVKVIDTPGFGNAIDHKHAVRPILQYIDRCRAEQFECQMGARPGDEEYSYDCLVHCCIYFIPPHRFLDIDRHFLQQVQRELAIAPVGAGHERDTRDFKGASLGRVPRVSADVWDER